MYRIFHTADWHLGQTFHNFERDFEHARFLEWLLVQLRERRPDALLIAGDVFDSINPSAAAQRRYYSFLQDAREALPQMQMVVTAGNHDAGGRLEAPSDLLRALDIHVVGTVARQEGGGIEVSKFLVPLADGGGQVRALVLAVPFLRPADVPLVPGARDAYLEGIGALYARVSEEARVWRDAKHPGAALVGMGHCHMQAGVQSVESERSIVVGGVEGLGVEVFPGSLAYVALGHLHKPQSLDGGRIRYSGSPIPLSFSEIGYEHQVLEISLDGECLAGVSSLRVPRRVALLRVPERGVAPLEEILKRLKELPGEGELAVELHPFLEVRVLNDGPDPARRRRIEEALEGKAVRLASLRLENAQQAGEVAGAVRVRDMGDLRSMDPLQIMANAHRDSFASEPDAELVAALNEILQETSL